MVTATLNNTVLASSDRTQVVEGNHYFPPDSIKNEFFKPSDTHTTCSWKGVASYYNAQVGDQLVPDAAWYYPKTTTDKAKPIEGWVAFYKNKVDVK
ncbi:hypothetical protein DMC30DRAFT_448978 [Rhodotorula diobovata]|uniref:DUF427 domain-containing protein n=1 Tax=Rhodotorula diobovata TaxID=5288 RepID=A0A5C5FPP0_9BASI|nr:hypothetical protein DMC30DRAFT_448978 [Rhodotorula diobovata]